MNSGDIILVNNIEELEYFGDDDDVALGGLKLVIGYG